MAKYHLRIKARDLREKGVSVREISKKLGVSKGTVSIWVRDIILTLEQLERLQQRSLKGAELGRTKGSLVQKRRRMELIEKSKKDGIAKVGRMSEKEFFLTGVALYWAEGSKKRREVSFCNSDPRLINLMIGWLEKFFDIGKARLAVSVGINEIHRKREKKVKNQWSLVTGVPLSQFRKTSFKKSKNKKVYKNYDQHYGTLTVRVLKPGDIYYKIMGLIEGLSVSQCSSGAEQGFHKSEVTGSNPVTGTNLF